MSDEQNEAMVFITTKTELAQINALREAVLEIDKAIQCGDLIWKRRRQSDSDPYHQANVKLTAAIKLLEQKA